MLELPDEIQRLIVIVAAFLNRRATIGQLRRALREVQAALG